ncbi:hypothetical protein LCGC14_0225380 [marine sediment metagenome]|uniref:Uncharacterized protein n=1 Tax=marine sediment metagenome TaxID=412755 RepID=A0A0F9UH20_9ZZZZ
MRLISAYAPPTFTKPVLLLSTAVHTHNITGKIDENETAIYFIEALNVNHALNRFDFTDGGWKAIKYHKSQRKAVKYHTKLTAKLCRSNKTHYEFYLVLLHLYGDK